MKNESSKMEDDRKSRTQMKKEVKALQELGEKLLELSAYQLKKIDMPEELLSAVEEAHHMPQHEAKRRQMQYIGKLMRKIDTSPIEKAIHNVRQGDYLKAIEFKKAERWRDELSAGNMEILEEVMSSCPKAQRQRLAQLARNAQKLEAGTKAKKASRALFSYIKEIYEG